MKKMRKMGLMLGMVFILFLLETPFSDGRDLDDFWTRFHPYITVQEEYNSNINLTPTNRKDDFITTISPGIKFSNTNQHYGLDLDYHLGFVFYAKGHEKNDNYVSMAGSLNAWYTPAQGLTFHVRDSLTRSDEAREREYSATALEGQYLLATTRERVTYFRNVFEPSAEYQFGKEDRFSVQYRNNIYEVQSRRFEDSQENFISPKLTYWFDIRNGISLEYGLTLGNFDRSPDLTGHMATGRFTHRFNPRTSIFGEYTFLRRDFKSPSVDYDVQRPTFGIEHAFSPTLSGRAQAGYFWEKPEKGPKMKGPSYDMSLTQRAEKTTYTLSYQGGYTEDYFTAENLGFNKYQRAIGTITHRLLERMNVGLFGSLERAKFGDGRIDRIWGIGGNTSYLVLKWLTVSLEASHRKNQSNIDQLDYSEYRGIFRITASF